MAVCDIVDSKKCQTKASLKKCPKIKPVTNVKKCMFVMVTVTWLAQSRDDDPVKKVHLGFYLKSQKWRLFRFELWSPEPSQRKGDEVTSSWITTQNRWVKTDLKKNSPFGSWKGGSKIKYPYCRIFLSPVVVLIASWSEDLQTFWHRNMGEE